MTKKFLLTVFVLIAVFCIIIFFPSKKILTKTQNKNCFCSSPTDVGMMACFDSSDKGYVVWNSRFNLALTPIKAPFLTGTWTRIKGKILISFSNGREVEIKHNYPEDGLYPQGIIIENLILRPDFCENLDWQNLSTMFNKSKDFSYVCSKQAEEKKLNIQINLKNNTFKTWQKNTLFARESIFLEEPFKKGKIRLTGDKIIFNFEDGMERAGKIIQREIGSNSPEIVKFGSGKEEFSVSKDQCDWLNNSISKIPLLNAKNVLCEKNKNDDVVKFRENQEMDMYLNTAEFTLKDFLEDKQTYKRIKYQLNSNNIIFNFKGTARRGTFKKDGEKFIWLKFVKDKKGNMLEYSREYCGSFFLTNKFPK